jgi:PAS domain S-box-containing protein
MLCTEKLDILLQNLPDAVFIGDESGIVRVNEAALELLGLEAEEFEGMALAQFSERLNFRFSQTGKPVEKGSGPLSRALKGEKSIVELIITHPATGKQVDLRCAASPVFEDGTVVSGILVMTDITNQLQFEHRLQQMLTSQMRNNQEQEAVLESIPDALFIGNKEGITKCNQAALDLLGCDSIDEINNKFDDLSNLLNTRNIEDGKRIKPEDTAFMQALAGSRVVSEVVVNNLKTGKDVFLRSAASPIWHNGQLIGATAVFTDITDKILNERKLQRTLQEIKSINNELDAFTYAVSHDLKSPLGRIQGLATILLKSTESQISDKDKYLLNLIVQSSEKLSELVNQMLNLGRIGQMELDYSSINLTRMCRQILEGLDYDEKAVKVTLMENMMIWGDRALLMSVFQNLLSNAIKYSSKSKNPEVKVGSHEVDGHIVYYVRDNGIGFSMEEAAKLFVPFKRLNSGTNFEGTGVGLSTVKKIVERHEGRIWAESELGKGATFFFTLPSRKGMAMPEDRRPFILHREMRNVIAAKLSA